LADRAARPVLNFADAEDPDLHWRKLRAPGVLPHQAAAEVYYGAAAAERRETMRLE
jgi:hypothetical protein